MANRYFRQFRASPEPAIVDIFANVTFGASGAPTLVTGKSKGVVSVTRNSTGVYTFVFGQSATNIDTYPQLMCISQVFQIGSGHPALDMFVVVNNISTTGSIQVEFDSAGVATDPINGSQVLLDFVFKNSTAF